jgi:hypothetical protein
MSIFQRVRDQLSSQKQAEAPKPTQDAQIARSAQVHTPEPKVDLDAKLKPEVKAETAQAGVAAAKQGTVVNGEAAVAQQGAAGTKPQTSDQNERMKNPSQKPNSLSY